MEIHRFGVKFYAADPAAVKVEKFIPIFHRWIQRQNLAGHLLIDVHDYSHLNQGPGILLVAHQGNLSIDLSDGRPGLLYYRKTPASQSSAEHLTTVLGTAIQASRLLEKDAKLKFNHDEFVVLANDRLNAPNNDETFDGLRTPLTTALQQVFEGAKFDLTRTSLDPKDRLTVMCRRVHPPRN
jgi:hypothetical protein